MNSGILKSLLLGSTVGTFTTVFANEEIIAADVELSEEENSVKTLMTRTKLAAVMLARQINLENE